MSEIKALEDLREWAQGFNASLLKELREDVLKACDEIEDEIAKRYMLLPVDADGVPIHIYDKLLKSTGAAKPTYGEVVGISDDSVFFNANQGWESNWSKLTRHVKPRTLEDVLKEYADEYYKLVRDGLGSIAKLKMEKAAAEIRELLGGDAS